MRVEAHPWEVPLRAPLASAHGTTEVRRLVHLRILDDDGVAGHGEAAPLPSYDGTTVEDVLAALQAWSPGGPLPALPQAAAAIDLALWDLRGRRAGQPVWRLLDVPSAPAPVEVNATIGGVEPSQAAAAAAAARAAGFGCVKVKIGVGDDLPRVHAVRDAVGPEMAIRLDANGAWSVEEAASALERLGALNPELCEEPVHGVEALGQLSSLTPVPIAADESVAAPGLLERRVCTAVCLKIAASGGITGVVRDAERARRAGYEVYLASTLDGPLGIAAALHAAAAIAPDRPCGLGTLPLLEVEAPFLTVDGRIAVPGAPGLGIPCTWP